MTQSVEVQRPSIYEFAGGACAFRALATAFHELCVHDAVLEHPFSHSRPGHVERLAAYWAEVLGGPPANLYPEGGGHSPMLAMHAGMGADDDLGEHFLACFIQAMDDAALPEDLALRTAMSSYMEWAVGEVMALSPPDSIVEPLLPVPRWSWDGLQPPKH